MLIYVILLHFLKQVFKKDNSFYECLGLQTFCEHISSRSRFMVYKKELYYVWGLDVLYQENIKHECLSTEIE